MNIGLRSKLRHFRSSFFCQLSAQERDISLYELNLWVLLQAYFTHLFYHRYYFYLYRKCESNSMEHSPPWWACRRLTVQENPHNLTRKSTAAFMSPPLAPAMSQFSPRHILTPFSLRSLRCDPIIYASVFEVGSIFRLPHMHRSHFDACFHTSYLPWFGHSNDCLFGE
jgi:hypothetical protein